MRYLSDDYYPFNLYQNPTLHAHLACNTYLGSAQHDEFLNVRNFVEYDVERDDYPAHCRGVGPSLGGARESSEQGRRRAAAAQGAAAAGEGENQKAGGGPERFENVENTGTTTPAPKIGPAKFLEFEGAFQKAGFTIETQPNTWRIEDIIFKVAGPAAAEAFSGGGGGASSDPGQDEGAPKSDKSEDTRSSLSVEMQTGHYRDWNFPDLNWVEVCLLVYFCLGLVCFVFYVLTKLLVEQCGKRGKGLRGCLRRNCCTRRGCCARLCGCARVHADRGAEERDSRTTTSSSSGERASSRLTSQSLDALQRRKKFDELDADPRRVRLKKYRGDDPRQNDKSGSSDAAFLRRRRFGAAGSGPPEPRRSNWSSSDDESSPQHQRVPATTSNTRARRGRSPLTRARPPPPYVLDSAEENVVSHKATSALLPEESAAEGALLPARNSHDFPARPPSGERTTTSLQLPPTDGEQLPAAPMLPAISPGNTGDSSSHHDDRLSDSTPFTPHRRASFASSSASLMHFDNPNAVARDFRKDFQRSQSVGAAGENIRRGPGRIRKRDRIRAYVKKCLEKAGDLRRKLGEGDHSCQPAYCPDENPAERQATLRRRLKAPKALAEKDDRGRSLRRGQSLPVRSSSSESLARLAARAKRRGRENRESVEGCSAEEEGSIFFETGLRRRRNGADQNGPFGEKSPSVSTPSTQTPSPRLRHPPQPASTSEDSEDPGTDTSQEKRDELGAEIRRQKKYTRCRKFNWFVLFPLFVLSIPLFILSRTLRTRQKDVDCAALLRRVCHDPTKGQTKPNADLCLDTREPILASTSEEEDFDYCQLSKVKLTKVALGAEKLEFSLPPQEAIGINGFLRSLLPDILIWEGKLGFLVVEYVGWSVAELMPDAFGAERPFAHTVAPDASSGEKPRTYGFPAGVDPMSTNPGAGTSSSPEHSTFGGAAEEEKPTNKKQSGEGTLWRRVDPTERPFLKVIMCPGNGSFFQKLFGSLWPTYACVFPDVSNDATAAQIEHNENLEEKEDLPIPVDKGYGFGLRGNFFLWFLAGMLIQTDLSQSILQGTMTTEYNIQVKSGVTRLDRVSNTVLQMDLEERRAYRLQVDLNIHSYLPLHGRNKRPAEGTKEAEHWKPSKNVHVRMSFPKAWREQAQQHRAGGKPITKTANMSCRSGFRLWLSILGKPSTWWSLWRESFSCGAGNDSERRKMEAVNIMKTWNEYMESGKASEFSGEVIHFMKKQRKDHA